MKRCIHESNSPFHQGRRTHARVGVLEGAEGGAEKWAFPLFAYHQKKPVSGEAREKIKSNLGSKSTPKTVKCLGERGHYRGQSEGIWSAVKTIGPRRLHVYVEGALLRAVRRAHSPVVGVPYGVRIPPRDSFEFVQKGARGRLPRVQ